jgi:hypothetical protein
MTRAVGQLVVVLSTSISLTASAAPASEKLDTPQTGTGPEESEPATWVDPSREEQAPGPASKPPLRVDPANHKLVVAGNVLTGLGVGAFITMTAGFVVMSGARDELGYAKRREDEDAIAKFEKRERTGLAIGIAGAAATGALLITGLTLIGVGRQRERKRRAALSEQSLLPVLGPRTAGLRWSFRF